MTERTMPPMERTIDQWRSCDPAMMAVQSIPAIRFALADAQHDILALAAENAALQARVAELKSATGELLDCMFHDGVPVDPEHPKRIAVEAAHAALHASSPDQSVDANKMGGGDCAGGGKEG